MNLEFDIDSDAFVFFTEKLERLPEKVLPKAVKETLNKLALDLKRNSMPESAKKTFVNRQKNFFKANSRINFARGSSIPSLKAKVGFQSLGSSNRAVDNLEKQEKGGQINKRSFVPTTGSRISKNKGRKVSKKNQLGSIRNIVRSTSTKTFAKSVYIAGKGGHVLHNNMLFRVDSIRGRKFRLTAIYTFKKGRSVSVRSTKFMENASMKTLEKAPEFFKDEAEFRIKRHFSKR